MSEISNDYKHLISVTETAPRATPLPAGRQFGEVAKRFGAGLVRGVETVAAFSPAGSMVSGALRGGSPFGARSLALLTAGGSVEAPGGGSVADALTDGEEMSPEQLIELQRQVNQEQLTYSTVSNVMKARHDSAKQVTNNMR